MLNRIATHWRMVFTVAILVGLAALALAKGVSVLAEDRGSSGGQPRQTVQPLSGQPTEQVHGVRGGQEAPGTADAGVRAIAPTPQAPSKVTYHTVQMGETLGKIALKYGVTAAAIANANGISNADLIRVGQRLTIPSR